MKAKILISIMTSLLFSLLVGPLLASPIGVDPLAASGTLFALSFIPKPAGIMAMALDVEIWKPWIVDELFTNNDFLNAARNADEHVLQGKVVHIPNAGTASDVERNRSSLPASITKRTDLDVTYALDEFTSNPRRLEAADKILSYDKMNSAMGQDMRAIRDIVARWMIYHWATYSASTGDTAALNQIATTGAAVTNYLPGTTGTRKKFQLINLEEAQARLDDQDVPEEERYALISARALQQIVSQLSTGDYKDFSRVYDPVKGIVGQLFGFKFYKRSSVVRFNNLATKLAKAPDAANTTSDNDAVLCWQRDHVERAIGTTEIFEQLKAPTYYGDIYSLLIRAGGRRVAADGRGLVAIVQST